jgi:Protein of unknown function (DUF3843)
MSSMNSQQLQAALSKLWMESRPYSDLGAYDKFYIGVAKKLASCLIDSASLNFSVTPKQADRVEIAVIIAAYFEDFISEIGIWRAFIDRHFEVAERYLPFFDLSDYDPEYVNAKDIRFLLWVWANNLQIDSFLDPCLFVNPKLEQDLFEILEASIDHAPATSFFDEFLTLADDADFIAARKCIQWLACNSYLFGQLDLGILFQSKIQSNYRKSPELKDEDRKMIQYDLRLDIALNKITRLGGLRMPEMAARILRGSKAKLLQVAQISEKTAGRFLIQEIASTHYTLQHLPSQRQLRVVLQSGNVALKQGACITTSLVKWQDEFWITGLIIGTKDDNLESEPDVVSVPLAFASDEEYQKAEDYVETQERAFVGVHGSQLVVCDDLAEATEALRRYLLALEKQNALEAGREPQHDIPPLDLSMYAADESLCLFFQSGAGLQFVPQAIDIVDFLTGRYIGNREAAREVFVDIFEYTTLAFVEYLATHYGFDRLSLTGQRFDAERDRVALTWFLNPQECGPARPEISLAVK